MSERYKKTIYELSMNQGKIIYTLEAILYRLVCPPRKSAIYYKYSIALREA
jgi:hypothetical protein